MQRSAEVGWADSLFREHAGSEQQKLLRRICATAALIAATRTFRPNLAAGLGARIDESRRPRGVVDERA